MARPPENNRAGLVPQAVVRLDWRLYQEVDIAPRFCVTFAETKVTVSYSPRQKWQSSFFLKKNNKLLMV